MGAEDRQTPLSPGSGESEARFPTEAAERDYRAAAEDFGAALELLEELRRKPKEDRRRRELHRSLRRRTRRGFRRLQRARRVGTQHQAQEKLPEREGESETVPFEGGGTAAEKAEERFRQLVLSGGEGLLEQEESRVDVRDGVAGALSAALRNYLQPDDRYRPFIRPEALPEGLRLLLRRIFPVLLGPESGYNRQTGETEPTGIDDPAEEEVRHTNFIRLPLGQAKQLLAEELIPELEERTARGADAESEEALRRARERLAELENIRLEPRAKPFVPERGFYTEQITRFSPQGELLVSLQIPGIVRSGTNLDRMRELVKLELVWRLAGKGVCRELDEELEWVRSRESGPAGSSLQPRSKMDVERSFSYLRRSFPVLAALESREGTRRLLAGTARSLQRGGKKFLRRRFRELISADALPPSGEEEAQ